MKISLTIEVDVADLNPNDVTDNPDVLARAIKDEVVNRIALRPNVNPDNYKIMGGHVSRIIVKEYKRIGE